MQSAGCAVCFRRIRANFVRFEWRCMFFCRKTHVHWRAILPSNPCPRSVHTPSMSTSHPCPHFIHVHTPSMSAHRRCPHTVHAHMFVHLLHTHTHLDSQCVCTCIWIHIPIHLWLPARLTLPWPPLYFDAVLTACAPVVSHDAFNCFAHTTVNYLSGTMFGVDIFIWFDVWGWHFSIKAFFTTRCNVKIEIIMIR